VSETLLGVANYLRYRISSIRMRMFYIMTNTGDVLM